jgi:hypothetical protein
MIAFSKLCQRDECRFNELQIQIYDNIIEQLKEFHQTELLKIKTEIANSLYELCSAFQITFHERFNLFKEYFDIRLATVSSLKAQITHFIELYHH